MAANESPDTFVLFAKEYAHTFGGDLLPLDPMSTEEEEEKERSSFDTRLESVKKPVSASPSKAGPLDIVFIHNGDTVRGIINKKMIMV